MNDLTRYACQLPLDGFGKSAQQKLSKAKVLIVGVGGLGCPASLYLTSIGVGEIGLADFDRISLKNLHRQILFNEKDVGRIKAKVAAKRLKLQNPSVNFACHTKKITSKNVMDIINQYDIVVDCTDNFTTRYLLNDACVIQKKPLVYGAIFQFEGQVAVFNIKKGDKFTPNYRDVFPNADDAFVPNCDEGGVLPAIAGVIGSIQAGEVIKLVTGIGEVLVGKLFIFNLQNMKSYTTYLPAFSKVKIEKLEQDIIPVISTDKFKKEIGKKGYELIDVRTKEEHSLSNIGGRNIPLHDLKQNISLYKFDKPTVVYCRSGARSASAVKLILNFNPKAKVKNLEGGILAWEAI